MKNKKIYMLLSLLITMVTTTVFVACDPVIEPGEVPQVLFPTDSLVVDLNELNHPPLICVVKSETGLKSIELFVVNKNGEQERIDKTITAFYNRYNHSVNIKPVYTNNMVKIVVVATDLAGQKTSTELPVKVIPLLGLPEIIFSDGTSEINHIEYIEGDESPDVYAVIKSEETINYLIFYRVKGLFTQVINDTIRFYAGEKEATVNLKTAGDGYNFERGLTALKAKVVVGPRNKSQEVVLDVTFRAAIKVHLTQSEEDFNGLVKNATVPFSGTLEVATSVNSLKYKLIARDGSLITGDQNVNFNTDNSFSGSFTAHPTLGSIVFTATTTDNKTDELTVNVHVGYKLYHMLASLSGSSTYNINTTPGCFFSAEKGRIYDYCGANDNSEFIDVGFATWNTNADIRMHRLDTPSKLRTTQGTCNPNAYEGLVQNWPVLNLYDVATSSISYANYQKSTITDIENETVGSNLTSGVTMVVAFATNPSGQKVGIYQTMINGVPKKVIISYDKLEKFNSSQPIYSTFWFYAKVQL